jgi:hypothetical protein
MKKFSKITGEKVNQEPIQSNPDKKTLEQEQLYYSVLKLTDELLQIRSYGSARQELLNGALSISGKEDLAMSIVDLIMNKSLDTKAAVLESLNSRISNSIIESQLFEAKKEKLRKRDLEDNYTFVKKVEKFISKNSIQVDFDLIMERWVERSQPGESSINKSKIVSKMIEEPLYSHLDKVALDKMSKLYQIRSKKLR